MMKTIAVLVALAPLAALVVACDSTTEDGTHDTAQEACSAASGNCVCKQSCSHTCSGSACEYTCNAGATCSFSCPQGGCNVQSEGSVTVDCPGGNCTVQCSGPQCKVTGCKDGCRVVCGGAAECSSSCSGASCTTVP